jgi:hypothetical protein
MVLQDCVGEEQGLSPVTMLNRRPASFVHHSKCWAAVISSSPSGRCVHTPHWQMFQNALNGSVQDANFVCCPFVTHTHTHTHTHSLWSDATIVWTLATFSSFPDIDSLLMHFSSCCGCWLSWSCAADFMSVTSTGCTVTCSSFHFWFP